MTEIFYPIILQIFSQRNVPIHRFTIPEIWEITVFLDVDSKFYKCSFIPIVVNEWNALSVDTRQSDPIRIFKKQLAANISYNNCNTTANKSRPEFYSFGDRYTNIIHT